MSIESIAVVADRVLTRMVLFELEFTVDEYGSRIFTNHGSQNVSGIAHDLRESCTVSNAEGDAIRLLRFSNVLKCRNALTSIKMITSLVQNSSVDGRTLEKIEAVLASNGVILKELCHKLRCCLSISSVENLLAGIAYSKAGSGSQPVRPSLSKVRTMPHEVANYFISNKERYWRGDPCLLRLVQSPRTYVVIRS